MKDLIVKSAVVDKLVVTDDELKLINKYTTEDLTSDDVFVFKVAICDNEVDRVFEVFPLATLHEMSKLYVGKTIMKDHRQQTDNQVARIYATEVVAGTGTTKNNETYAQLVAHCYMVKTDSNKDLITEIKAGIKKEVSVGCMILKAVCSICGVDNRNGYCKHYNGVEYDGAKCYFKLLSATDAYEVSFVAVPAQPKAGVTKSYTGEQQENKSNEEELQKSELQKDFINTEVSIYESFIFIEKERG